MTGKIIRTVKELKEFLKDVDDKLLIEYYTSPGYLRTVEVFVHDEHILIAPADGRKNSTYETT